MDLLTGRLAAVPVLGLLTSGWYSVLNARLYDAVPEGSGTAIAVSNVYGLIWPLVPIGLGLVAQRTGLPAMMWLLWAGPLFLLAGVRR